MIAIPRPGLQSAQAVAFVSVERWLGLSQLVAFALFASLFFSLRVVAITEIKIIDFLADCQQSQLCIRGLRC